MMNDRVKTDIHRCCGLNRPKCHPTCPGFYHVLKEPILIISSDDEKYTDEAIYLYENMKKSMDKK